MTSRFWGGGSDSEEDSDKTASSDDSSEEETGNQGVSKFLRSDSDESDDSDAGRRVVRSAKDKRFLEMGETCKEIQNKMKINDWVSLQTLFDKLNKQLEKTSRFTEGAPPPKFYYKCLISLEDFMISSLNNRETKKKMSPTNAKSLNIMKQKLKKHNKEIEEAIEKVRANPESSEDEASGNDNDDDEPVKSSSKTKKTKKTKKASGSDSDGDSDSDSDDEDVAKPVFVKMKSKQDQRKEREFQVKPDQITFEMVDKKMREIMMSRGKKGVDKHEQVEALKYLITVAKTTAQKIEVMVNLISSYFDVMPSMSTHLPVAVWRKTTGQLLELMVILKENPNIVMDATYDADAERDEDDDQAPVDENPDAPIKVWGNLLAFLERLDEMFKSLQVIDPHTQDYVYLLKDEPVFMVLAHLISDYFERQGDHISVSKVSLRRLEHVYHKREEVYDAMVKLSIHQQHDANVAFEARKLKGDAIQDGFDDEPTLAEQIADEEERMERTLKRRTPRPSWIA